MIKAIAKKIAVKVKSKNQSIENGVEYTRIKRKVITKIKRKIECQSDPPAGKAKLIQALKQIWLAGQFKNAFCNLKDKFDYLSVRRPVQESDQNETFQTEIEIMVPSEESDSLCMPLQF